MLLSRGRSSAWLERLPVTQKVASSSLVGPAMKAHKNMGFFFLSMNYDVYIIQSQLDSSYYIGYSNNVQLRLERHNLGLTKSTKAKRPWKIVYSEHYDSKTKALQREREIKRMKSRIYIERLIEHAEGRPD